MRVVSALVGRFGAAVRDINATSRGCNEDRRSNRSLNPYLSIPMTRSPPGPTYFDVLRMIMLWPFSAPQPDLGDTQRINGCYKHTLLLLPNTAL